MITTQTLLLFAPTVQNKTGKAVLVSQTAANCYSGQPQWIGKGICQAGVQICKSGYWGMCTGEKLPEPEACDSKDNNCNGLIDEGVLSSCGTCDLSCIKQKIGPDFGVPFDVGN